MLSKSFRHVLLTSTAVVAGVVLAGPALAGTTADVNLSGTVTTTLELTSVTTAGAGTLVLQGAATPVYVQVADLAIHTNNEEGYTLTMSQGDLTNTTDLTSPATIAFQVAAVVDGGDGTAATYGAGATRTYATAAANAAGTGALDLYIKYTPAPLQDPGTYTGTVTLTVADN